MLEFPLLSEPAQLVAKGGHPTSLSIGLPSEVEPAQPRTKPTLELARRI